MGKYKDGECMRCKEYKEHCYTIPVGKYIGKLICGDCAEKIWNFIMTEPEDEKEFAQQEYSAWLGGKEISGESKELINIHIGKVFNLEQA